jgi:hypothetical protein
VTTGLDGPAAAGRRCCLCAGADFHLVHRWEAGHRRNSAAIPLARAGALKWDRAVAEAWRGDE